MENLWVFYSWEQTSASVELLLFMSCGWRNFIYTELDTEIVEFNKKNCVIVKLS